MLKGAGLTLCSCDGTFEACGLGVLDFQIVWVEIAKGQ